MPTINALDFPVVASVFIETNRRHYVEFGIRARTTNLDRRVSPVEFAIDLIIGKNITYLGAVIECSVADNHYYQTDRINLKSTLCMCKPVKIKRYI